MKKFYFILFSVIMFSASTWSSENLELVILMTRHGSRAAFKNIVNAAHHWKKNDIQQLTPVGMNQAYKFGQDLSRTYIDKLNFLPKEYSNQSIYVLSDDFQRTIVTAECVLMGLYPPGTGPDLTKNKPALPNKFQPVPIRTLPYGASNLIQGNLNVPEAIMNKYLFHTEKWKNKLTEIKPKYDEWTKELGNKINNYNDVVGIGDTLETLKVNGYQYPPNLTEKNAEQIINFDKFFLIEQYRPVEIAYFRNHELLNKISKDLKEKVSGKSTYKLIYYSGHDLNILGIMSLLGRPLEEQPQLVSNIEIELYKNNKQKYTIKVKYNQKYITLPFTSKQKEASLDNFFSYIKDLNSRYNYLLRAEK